MGTTTPTWKLRQTSLSKIPSTMRHICISLIVLSAFIIASTFAQLDQCVCSYCLECVENCEAQLKEVVEACEGVDTECVKETVEELDRVNRADSAFSILKLVS